MDRLQDAVNRLGRSIAERSGQGLTTGQQPVSQVNGQLALGLSGSRSKRPGWLFEPGAESPRAYLSARPVRLPTHEQALYSGPQLRSDDRAVWLQLVQWRCLTGKDRLEFSSLSFLKALGWGHSRHDVLRLRTCLERLLATALRLHEDQQVQHTRSLIHYCEWRRSPGGQSGRWRVWLDAELATRFEQELGENQHASAHVLSGSPQAA